MRATSGLRRQRRLNLLGFFAVLLIASLSAGCIGLAGSSGNSKLTDSTPAAADVSATSAVVTWTTNMAASSQVVYGPTTDYGQSTPLNNTMVTSHSVTLTGLTTGIQYHYKCQSQAADGSTSTTADQTFTTGAGGDTTPPAVAITSPINGATVSGTVTMSASATDNVAVANVQFQLDGNNIGAAATASPYNYSWDTTTTANGNHTVAAIATDTSGNAASSAVETITVSNAQSSPPPPAGPTVSITSPGNNATVNGTVTVIAAASDSVAITSVQLQVDGANTGAAITSAPYNFSWNTSSVSNAGHTLTAVATDMDGNSATSAAVKVTVSNGDNTPPSVSITSPGNNATVSGTVSVSATASDNVAVASVQLQVDGANVGSADTNSPYNFSWSSTSVSNGSHTLTAVAKDSSGNSATSAGVKVTVNNNSDTTPPTVSITSPANNATVSGVVTVNATAADNVAVASVQLQVDGANVGSADTSSPYSFSWSSTSVSNGSHTLTAVAKDTSGNKTTSAGVKATVSNSTDTTPPTVSITSPGNNATVSGTVTVSATASDNVGVASVQFQVDGNNVGAADTSSPYNFSWNTASYANGSHALAAIAKDAAGNSAVSSTVNVTVSNASSGSGSGIPSTLGWFDVAGQQIAPNCPPDPSNTGSCYGVVDAWNSGIADTNRNILWVWGGGHNDYSGNEIYAFNLNTLKLTRANNPADPTPTCTPGFSNGTPSSRHTYGGTVYMPNVDKMLVFGGVPYCPSGGFISDTWTLDMSQVGSSGAGGWTQQNPTISGNGGVAPDNQFGNAQLQYDPNTQTAILNESTYGLWSYNATTNTYTHLGSAPSSLSLHEGTVIDPLHKLFLRFGDNHAESISIAPGSDYSVTTLKASGCSGLEGNNPGLQWDPVLQLVVGWPNFGGTVYLYNPVSDACTTQTYSASVPPDSDMTGTPSTTNGTFKRFGYFPALGVYALVNEWNIDAHTLRLTAGGGSGGGSSTTTISNVTASNITTNSATISWTTSAAATSQVVYGTTSSLGSLTTKNTTMATSHSQTLTGLSVNTLYFFEAESVDGSGNTVTSSVLSFGTTNTTDTTPPTVSMTAPANGSSVSGTVTVSANASDNVAVANVQFLLDGANLGSADAASPYSVSWDTTTASNGSHILSATATDTSGNSSTATAVTVTVSNASGSGGDTNANADFQARCAAAGVIRCVSFDTAASVSGNAAPGLPLITGGLTTPTVDTTVFASGGGSLHFAVPAGATSPNTSGSFDIDFSDDFSQQIDSLINGDPLSKTTACGGSPCKNEIWIQWRQRFDSGMLQKFANSNGWKQVIVGEGDTASTLSYSCSDLETVVENSNQFEIPRMYHSCGQKLDEYDPLEVNTGRTDSNGNSLFSPQNAAGGYLNCTFTVTINIPTIPPCVPYVANQWMTFQMHIQVGTWYPAGVSSNGGPPAPFKHDSTIQLYVAQEGQASQLVMDMRPGATSAACDAEQQDIPSCQTGYDLVNPTAYGQADGNGNMIREKFGKIWLLPYQTNLDCPSCAAANTWYDELIISYQQVADPKF